MAAQAELGEQPVQFVERTEADRDLALLAVLGAPLDADLDGGSQCIGQLLLDAQQIAKVAGTISYNILCNISARVRRVYC